MFFIVGPVFIPKKQRSILFLTSNAGKFREAQTILKTFGVSIVRKPAKGIEIQSDSLEEVARVCAENAYRRFRVPLLVEDSGLFIDALNGFPGVYSADIYHQVGCEGILRLLAQERQQSSARKADGAPTAINRAWARLVHRKRLLAFSIAHKGRRARSAKFVCALAYADSSGIRVFKGIVNGQIARRIHSGAGFGYDPIFIPSGCSKPFSAWPKVKATLSHRARAFELFGRFMKNKR